MSLIFFHLLVSITCLVEHSPVHASSSSVFSVSNLKYASHVFEPGLNQPVRKLNRVSVDEGDQIEQVARNALLKGLLIEGDIVAKDNKIRRTKRKIINEINRQTGESTRWPRGVVPYQIDPKFPDDRKQLVYRAMEHWHNYTCVRFEPYDPVRHQTHRSLLYFIDATICGSFIGYMVERNIRLYKSMVYLSKDCLLGNIIHELGHTIGFLHEHSRLDRDDHIRIDFKKIDPSVQAQYFKAMNGEPGYYGIQYDLSSIMHYGSSSGVITALDANRNFLMGQRESLSFLDIKLANMAYKCSARCKESLTCENDGFVDQNCECFCPEGFRGVRCEEIVTNSFNGELPILLQDIEENTLDCDFERNNLCKWSDDRSRAFESWTISRPEYHSLTETQYYFKKLSATFKTGPQNGDHQGNTSSRYVYLNSLRKSTENSNGILTSPKIKVAQRTTACIRFWYNMYQSEAERRYPLKIGNLSLNLRFENGSYKSLWSKEGNQGDSWHFDSVELELEPPLTAIYFEAYFRGYSYGDLALDDVKFKLGSCATLLGGGNKPTTTSQSVTNTTQASITTTTVTNCSECRVPTYSEWSEWSMCTDDCQSYRYRVRKCLNRDIGPCKGPSTEYEICSECGKEKQRGVGTWSLLDNLIRQYTLAKKVKRKEKAKSGLVESRSDEITTTQDPYELEQACGGEFLLEKNGSIYIASPNYPQQYPTNLRCTYYIKSPARTNLRFRIIDLDLEQARGSSCVDGIELRYYSLGQQGPIFCGTTTKSKLEFKSYRNFFVLVFRSEWAQSQSRRGFNVLLTVE